MAAGFPSSRVTDPVSHDQEKPSGTVVKPPPSKKPVIIEKKLAAPVTSEVACSGKQKVGIAHPPPPAGVPGPVIIVGAGTVIINDLPASRWSPSGDLVSCSALLGTPDPGTPRTVFMGGPTTTELAIVELEDLLEQRLAELERWNVEDQARFKKWFGKADEKTRKEMISRMKKMQKLLKDYDRDNFVGWTPSKADNDYDFYAQVTPSDPKSVELSNLYGTAGKDGPNSRAGVLAHEMSHFDKVAGTKDHKDTDGKTVYGQRRSKALAKRDPDKAVTNADNFEYWVEGQ